MVKEGWNTHDRGNKSGDFAVNVGDWVDELKGFQGVKGCKLHMSIVQTFANLNIAIILICIIII